MELDGQFILFIMRLYNFYICASEIIILQRPFKQWGLSTIVLFLGFAKVNNNVYCTVLFRTRNGNLHLYGWVRFQLYRLKTSPCIVYIYIDVFCVIMPFVFNSTHFVSSSKFLCCL